MLNYFAYYCYLKKKFLIFIVSLDNVCFLFIYLFIIVIFSSRKHWLLNFLFQPLTLPKRLFLLTVLFLRTWSNVPIIRITIRYNLIIYLYIMISIITNKITTYFIYSNYYHYERACLYSHYFCVCIFMFLARRQNLISEHEVLSLKGYFWVCILMSY